MRYKAYKKVDIPWLDEVPEHWEISRNKNIFKHVKNIIGKKSQSTQLLSLTTMGIKAINIEDTKGKSPVSYDTYQVVSKDDLVLCLFDLDVSAVFSDVSKYNGMISPAYQVFKTDKVCINFYKYLFDKIFQDRSYKVHSKSLRYTITPEGFLMLNMIIPPKEEQDQIAKFLDWKINDIDRLIGIREEKVRKISKIKTSFIENATSGKIGKKFINFKKVDIPWLDEIPEHWKIDRAKNLYKKESRPIKETDEVITCFRDGQVTLRKNRRTEGFTESILEHGYQGVRNGDLVIHVMDAFAGAIGVSDSDGKSTPVYNVCNGKIDLCNEYYAYLLRIAAKKGYIQSLYKGIRERSSDFRFDTFQKIILPVPPKEEQEQIVKKIEEQNCKTNKLIENIKFQIRNLKQLKQSLISDAVTGKIDVRNIKIPNFSKFENRYLEEDEDYLEDIKEV